MKIHPNKFNSSLSPNVTSSGAFASTQHPYKEYYLYIENLSSPTFAILPYRDLLLNSKHLTLEILHGLQILHVEKIIR